MSSSLRHINFSRTRAYQRIILPLPVHVRQPITIQRSIVDTTEPSKPRRAQEYEYDEEEDENRPWEFDDISSMAHSELERHREVRHYARIAAYEMPHLAQLAKPFIPPTKSQPLRFRYVTYIGEQHPAQSKVILQFAPLDLPLSPIQRSKLIKLVGPRYHPVKKTVKMSCEMFKHQLQNKRYLSGILDQLLIEAKDTTDTFQDLPFDFRHYKPKTIKPKFPYEWVLLAREKDLERKQNGTSVPII